MTIANILDGESAATVRAKLNAALAIVNALTGDEGVIAALAGLDTNGDPVTTALGDVASGTLSQLFGLSASGALTRQTVTSFGGSDWQTEIASASITGAQTKDFAIIGTGWKSHLLLCPSIQHDSGSGQTMQARFSADGGSTWTTAVDMSASIAASVVRDGIIRVTQLPSNYLFAECMSLNGTTKAVATSAVVMGALSGPVNRIRIQYSAGNIAGSATGILFGRI